LNILGISNLRAASEHRDFLFVSVAEVEEQLRAELKEIRARMDASAQEYHAKWERAVQGKFHFLKSDDWLINLRNELRKGSSDGVHCRVVSIAGPAGQGKSSLCREMLLPGYPGAFH
jgi:pantothenate kinase